MNRAWVCKGFWEWREAAFRPRRAARGGLPAPASAQKRLRDGFRQWLILWRYINMKVFVAGGTGAIGGHAIPALVRAGHHVTALVRTPQKAALLSKRGATPVMVSIFDRAA